MSITLHGEIKPDGTLNVPGKLSIPPGQVLVTVQAVEHLPITDEFWVAMQAIWDDLKARRGPTRTREEIDAEIDALRNDAEEEMQAIERLHLNSVSTKRASEENRS